jgi:hypothetical protein
MVTPKNSRETENARKTSIFKIPFDWRLLGSSEISKWIETYEYKNDASIRHCEEGIRFYPLERRDF